MRWYHPFTRNWADTDQGDDPSLAPVDIPLPLAQALVHVEDAIRHLPRWRLESVDAQHCTIHATRRTRIFSFVDDVTIRLEPTEQGTTRLHARSRSRIGFADLGQNRRNLKELLQFLAP
jgi:uncharacterized protein (DUF1499 family)